MVAACSGLLTSCETYDPKVKQMRDAQIMVEPRGDWYVGRRFLTRRTRFWGYLRRPGELWENSKLVVMNERNKLQPDRMPEVPVEGPAHGFDHNSEYRIWGRFSGRTIYDPNADLELPEFILDNYELVTRSPGFLFDPREKYDPLRLPAREVSGRGY